MASSHSVVEENLTCSICLDFFTDPVVLPCSHSFCNLCLERNWGVSGARQCPLCRKKSKRGPIKSQVIREISVEVAKKRRILNDGELCGIHDEKYELVCTFDQKLVCLRCVSDQHKNHNFCSISKAAEDHRIQLQQPLQQLETKLAGLTSKTASPHALTVLQSKAVEIERQIRVELKKLHEFLTQEESVRIAALKQDQQEKRVRITEKINEMSSSLSERIRKIKEDMNGNETLFLYNFRDIENRAKLAVPDLQINLGFSIDAAKHLDNLRFNVWEKMKNICPKYPSSLNLYVQGPPPSSSFITSPVPTPSYSHTPSSVSIPFTATSVLPKRQIAISLDLEEDSEEGLVEVSEEDVSDFLEEEEWP